MPRLRRVYQYSGRVQGVGFRYTVKNIALQYDVAGYVRNLEARPQVRVRTKRRWHDAVATIVDDDDPVARLDTFGDERHAGLVRKFGTSLLSIRIDVSG